MIHYILFAGFLILGIAYSSVFEWTLHKFVMHRRIRCPISWLEKALQYPFERHALVHHLVFHIDDKYHSTRREDHVTIPMAKWNGPVLILIASLPWWIAVFIAWIWLPFLWSIPVAVTFSLTAYFVTYEYFHWCMHDPRGRWFESTKWFKWIDRHHHNHHRHMGKNLNVVLPIADKFFGTYFPPTQA